mmetsp:Transcript_17387/g.26313  ORF Transcript_17387/g.26313 Transcript_17387/m.26313 type:complete len:111 (+) Transcript_17387:41-373(+)
MRSCSWFSIILLSVGCHLVLGGHDTLVERQGGLRRQAGKTEEHNQGGSLIDIFREIYQGSSLQEPRRVLANQQERMRLRLRATPTPAPVSDPTGMDGASFPWTLDLFNEP